MKLHCQCSPFEALPPKNWEGFRKQVQMAASNWGLAVEFLEGPTVTAAIANFTRMVQVQENARLAQPEDA